MQTVAIPLVVVSLLLAAGLRLPLLERCSALVPWVLLWGLLAFSTCAVIAYRPAPEEWSGLVEEGEDPGPEDPVPGDGGDGPPEPDLDRQLRLNALAHPLTLLPLALAAISLSYLLLDPDRARGTEATVAIILSLVVAAASFLWRYVVRYGDDHELLEQRLAELHERGRSRQEEREARSLGVRLERGFTETASLAGARILAELEREYAQLQEALASRREVDPLAVARVPALAAETRRRGLSVLADALELLEATAGSGRERLQAEIARLEREASSDLDGPPEGLVAIRDATLASQRERLALLDQLRLRVEQLLHQAGRCEASLHRTRIELAAIRTGSSEPSVNSVVEALRGTIQQAKEVQLKLKQLGY